MEFLLLIIALVGGAFLLRKGSVNSSTAELKSYATKMRSELSVDDDKLDMEMFGAVLKHSNDSGRNIHPEHLFKLSRALCVMFKHSDAAPLKTDETITTLLSRIDRGLSIDTQTERMRLNEFTAHSQSWIAKSVGRFIEVMQPLFPDLDEVGDSFVGEIYESCVKLIHRSPEPSKKLAEIVTALSQISGSGIQARNLPDHTVFFQKNTDVETLIEKHFHNTVIPTLCLGIEVTTKTRVPFTTRFEHTHVLGGTGHGKTQFLQSMILKDLNAALDGKGSLMVIDGQGDLIRRITKLKHFDPDEPGSLADKLMLIDANDVEHPVCLNMFDMNLERLESYGAAERERIFNATISLYEYFFGALLGAELTQKQSVIFKFLARLMFAIPDATIHTLLDVMENGEGYQPYIDKLDETSKRFFRTQFFNKSFDDTKEQIARRLWGVLSNGTLERMFSNPRNKVDIFDAINDGKIVLVNTAKDILQTDGSAIMGRFFIALLVQAAIQRQVIPEDRRRSTFAYIDEIQDYSKRPLNPPC